MTLKQEPDRSAQFFKKVYFAGVQRESGAGRISGECQFIEQERSFESFS